MNRRRGLFLLFAFLFLSRTLRVFSEEAVISIDAAKESGPVNKRVFGNNFIGYDPVTYEDWTDEYYGYSDYGAGLWDPKLKRPVKAVMDLAKATGMSVVRFPGGSGTHHYGWKNSIGKERKHFLFGLDEFLKACEEIGAEPVITLSYFTGDERDAAELVEYLNAPSDAGHPWAQKRAENGHPSPYHVKYFEIGNEVDSGDRRKIKKVFPQDYARRYLKYYEKMKAVDPSIEIGVVLFSDEWNREVLRIIKDKLDFGIVHVYPRPDVRGRAFAEMDPKDIYSETLGGALFKEEKALTEINRRIKEMTGKNIPLAITEYNGGFLGDKPWPYRHCLGTALLNAELLRIFMKPQHHILMANYWNFVNEYWGMVENGFDGDPAHLYDPYRQRPNFYVLRLYHEHFGDILLEAQGNGDLSVNASKSRDAKTLYLMVVNKNMTDNISARLRLNNFKAVRLDVKVLNGSRVEALNEGDLREVGIKETYLNSGERPSDTAGGFDLIFEPHSLTAIEIHAD